MYRYIHEKAKGMIVHDVQYQTDDLVHSSTSTSQQCILQPSSNNKPIPYVTPIVYIHSLVLDSNTWFQANSCNARAIRNETMILEALEEEELAVFSQELFNTLLHFYEEILGMAEAGGRPKPKIFTVFKRKMCNASSRVVAGVGLPVTGQAWQTRGKQVKRGKHCGTGKQQ